MDSPTHEKKRTLKRLADFFPEERIIVTAGVLALVVVALVLVPMTLSGGGLSSAPAFAMSKGSGNPVAEHWPFALVGLVAAILGMGYFMAARENAH